MNANQLKLLEQRLLDQQAELLGIADLIDSSAVSVKLDQSAIGRVSRVDAMQQQAMALASQERQDEHLRRIKSALARIDDGEFGDCLQCLNEIPMARLEIDPSIELCLDCASSSQC